MRSCPTATDGGATPITSSLEVERKYDVDEALVVPDLAQLPGVGSVTAERVHALKATYFDTADLRLRAAGITLRHRTGGTDAGWHLKLPAAGGREEVTVKAPAGAVPEALAGLVRARSRGQELEPVARLSTRRVTQRLVGPDGELLAEFADDTVSGRTLPGGAALVWREWEVELLGDDPALLDVVQVQLTAVGAAPSTSSSKLGRVLPAPADRIGPRPWWAATKGRQQGTAGAAVQAHLAAQVAELVRRDPMARRDLPDAVHAMRVATRRLRSALTTFRPLLHRAQTDPLRVELQWLAGALGAARDAEVLHARLLALLAAEPAELVLGRVQARIETAMTERHQRAHEQLRAALDGERYLQLLDALDALVAEPPFLDPARGDAEPVLAPLLRRAWRRLDRTMAAADRATGPRRHELLHEVRKDAKRARYAAEAVRPVFGRPARRFATAMERLQETLGDVQDGVVSREVLRELGARGHLAGENGFTFGRLHGLEQARAEAAVLRWPQARAAVSRPRLRHWFDG